MKLALWNQLKTLFRPIKKQE